MATTTTTLTPATFLASVACVPGTPQRATRSMLGKLGGLVTAKITNGATGPTVQCVATLLVAHTTGSTPTAASEGADWKTLAVLGGGGSTANAVSTFSFEVPPCCHLEIEFSGNTVQNVTVEAFITDYTDLQTA
jgi:hypothetical protein